ncbi:hypothetical protein CTAYLR_007789 [Chrysophaeum taylorii]|uniref:Uncharacterized protein n=1 Tax=Chrysophaeum taylorii TaxID=2483200 RepID=A0AAD7UIX9_9STRA|nr:hypothetical protein CTAYLR_007789 [Chrysophaeum taylorii]
MGWQVASVMKAVKVLGLIARLATRASYGCIARAFARWQAKTCQESAKSQRRALKVAAIAHLKALLERVDELERLVDLKEEHDESRPLGKYLTPTSSEWPPTRIARIGLGTFRCPSSGLVGTSSGDMARKIVLSALVYGYTICVMLGLGCSIGVNVWQEVKKSPRAVICGFCSQFGFMPLLAFVLCVALGVGETESVALLLLGMSPGGVTSTLFVYGCGANVTVSLVMTTLSTFAALFMMPFLLFVYMRPPLVSSNDSRISYGSIFVTLVIATMPAIVGWRIRAVRPRIGEFLERWATRVGFALVIAATVAVGAWPGSDGHGGVTFKAVACTLLMAPCGFLLGYGAAAVARLERVLARTVSIETGIQQVGIAGAIAVNSFDGNQLNKMVTLMVVFAAVTFVAGMVWTVILRSFDSDREDENDKPSSQFAPVTAIKEAPANHDDVEAG